MLATFRYPENGISLYLDTLLQLLSSSSEIAKEPFQLGLANDETRRFATGIIILFSIPSLVGFCEIFLTIIGYRFSIARTVTGEMVRFEKQAAQNQGRYRILSRLYFYFLHFLEMFSDKIENFYVDHTWAFPAFILLKILRFFVFLIRWFAQFWWLPVTLICSRTIKNVWKKEKNAPNSIVRSLGFPTKSTDYYRIARKERIRITLYGLFIIVAETMIHLHFIYLILQWFNSTECFYFTLLPQSRWTWHYGSAFSILTLLSLTTLLSFGNDFIKGKQSVKSIIFYICSIIHMALVFFNLLPTEIFLSRRGTLTLTIGAVLLTGAWFMLDNFIQSIQRIYNFYITGRSESLSFELLHNMKNNIHSVSSPLAWAQNQGFNDLIQKLPNEIQTGHKDQIDKIKTRLANAYSALNNITGVTDRLVQYSRISEDLKPGNPIEVLRKTVDDYVDDYKELTWKNINWNCDGNTNTRIRVNINKRRLKTMFMDIIQNSIDQKKTSKSQDMKITFRCNIAGINLQIKIIDNLGGVDDELIPRLGLPFTTTKKYHDKPGYGLALFNSTRTVAFMNGSINFDNETSNNIKGFCTTITLPLVSE